jgi:hypothetical protein
MELNSKVQFMKHYPFHIGDTIWLEYLRMEEKYSIGEQLRKVQFKVAQAPLSYRQINELSKDAVLKDDRENEKGWRKFSFLGLVFLHVVAELKSYGVRHEQLKQLTECFFKEPSEPDESINKMVAEWSVGCTWLGVEVVLAFYPNGDVAFYDPANYALLHKGMMGKVPTSYIHIRLNDIVNKIRKEAGVSEIPVTLSVSKSYLKSAVIGLTEKEEKLLEIVRNASYKTLRIKKKDGDTLVIHAERSGGDKITGADFEKLLKEKAYQTVTATNRDGKVVNLKVEETIKL